MKGRLYDLNKWNPMKRPVLILGIVEFLLEHAVSWLGPEIGKRVEDSQVMLSQNFHMNCEFVFNKLLEQLLDLRVREYVDTALRNEVLCNSPDFELNGEIGLLGFKEQARTLNDVGTCR